MKRSRIENPPSESVADGRGKNGRFLPGNKLSKGNALAKKAARVRNRLFDTVSLKDFDAIVKRVVKEAKSGQAWAVKLLFAYLLGDPISVDIYAQLEEMQNSISELQKESL